MITNLGWLGRNCLRSYPVREDAPRESLNSAWKLDDRVLADIFVTAPTVDDGVFVSAITITRRIISVTLASTKDGRSLGVASAVYGTDQPFAQKPIQPLEDGVAGSVTFGTALTPSFFEDPGLQLGIHLFPNSVQLETRTFLSTGPFPVRSFSVNAFPQISGTVEMQHNDRLVIARTDGVESGDPVVYFTFSLVDPGSFLSPCEVPTSPCQCILTPIQNINGVEGDVDGRITIEVVDELGNVTPLGSNALNFRLLRTGTVLCEKPVMPDDYGRLPGPANDYSDDEKPTADYKLPADTTFPEPIV